MLVGRLLHTLWQPTSKSCHLLDPFSIVLLHVVLCRCFLEYCTERLLGERLQRFGIQRSCRSGPERRLFELLLDLSRVREFGCDVWVRRLGAIKSCQSYQLKRAKKGTHFVLDSGWYWERTQFHLQGLTSALPSNSYRRILTVAFFSSTWSNISCICQCLS